MSIYSTTSTQIFTQQSSPLGNQAATDGPSPIESVAELGFSNEQAQYLVENGYDVEGIKQRLSEGFTPEEIYHAVVVKLLHDRVEISAYRALQEGIATLQLNLGRHSTRISGEQSAYLLHNCIRKAAHKDMRSKDGYVTLRAKFLNMKQLGPVIEQVSVITSDRDSKLTRATYTTFEALLANLDAHNTMVNAILFNAWGVPERKCCDHLAEIKEKAGYTGPLSL